MADVVVFMDWQNVYKRALGTFFPGPHFSTDGQVEPMQYAQMLCAKAPPGKKSATRTLKEVRLYTGRPDASKDGKTYGAHMRQCTAWEKLGVRVFARPLRYPRNWPTESSQEKGIDVSIAVDVVTLAVGREYDLAILASVDTDLVPAVEYVHKLQGIEIEGVEWYDGTSRALPVAGVWTHRLTRSDYQSVADGTDYNKFKK